MSSPTNPPPERPRLLSGDDLKLDLSQFAPEPLRPTQPSPTAPPENLIRSLADAAGFHSRHPAQPMLRQGQRTGRTVLLGARISPQTHDRFHQIVEEERRRFEAGEITHRVTLGEIVERALMALEREMAGKGRGAGT